MILPPSQKVLELNTCIKTAGENWLGREDEYKFWMVESFDWLKKINVGG